MEPFSFCNSEISEAKPVWSSPSVREKMGALSVDARRRPREGEGGVRLRTLGGEGVGEGYVCVNEFVHVRVREYVSVCVCSCF